MAATDNKGTVITNRDATPPVLNEAFLAKGVMLETIAVDEALTTDDAASIYRLCEVPSNARISEVLLSNDAATAGAFDIGVYKNTANGGAVVDADFFGSAVSVASAQKNLDVTHESGVFGVEDVELQLWEALGLTEDPKTTYDIALTTTTAMTAQATVGLKVRYVI